MITKEMMATYQINRLSKVAEALLQFKREGFEWVFESFNPELIEVERVQCYVTTTEDLVERMRDTVEDYLAYELAEEYGEVLEMEEFIIREYEAQGGWCDWMTIEDAIKEVHLEILLHRRELAEGR